MVTIFSISELACASRSGIELMRMDWLGMRLPNAFSSASAARAAIHAFNAGVVSSFAFGGSRGSAL